MRTFKKGLLFALSLLLSVSAICAGVFFNGGNSVKADAVDGAYVEMYSPNGNTQVVSADVEHLNPTVEDKANSPTGKALVMDYSPDHERSIDLVIPVESQSSEGFEGLAMWVDVPETDDSYSFTMYVSKNPAVWQPMNLGSPLTLVSEDGKITKQNSMWKRHYLNGFTGWVIMPKESYPDAAPEADMPYRLIIMFEKEDVYRTTPIKISIGTIGYYTDYDALLYTVAGETVMDEYYINQLNGYIEQIELLKAKDENQLAKKNAMLVHFANIKENFKSLPLKERVATARQLPIDYNAKMQDFRFGEVKSTKHVMNFAITSDTHFTNNWINENFLSALDDAKSLDNDLTAMFVLGDLSDNGISAAHPENSDLDNYYDWRDSYEYKNSKGEQIPIISIMGNHDVRGPFSEGYPESSYAPAVEYYIQREGGGALHFDKWINGYHFIFLNTDKYHSDNCYLSEETLLWLDQKLGENEDGKPIFVMIHQPLGVVHTMEGSSVTFEEVIAKHPTAIVSSGHTHAHFGTAKITNDGNGVYVNQPAMVVASVQYYFVEVYEGGVIYRARQASNDSWLVDYDVVVSLADRRVNAIFDAETAEEGRVEAIEGATAEKVAFDGVSQSAIKLTDAGSVDFKVRACGEISNYGGYAIYAQTSGANSLKFNGNRLIDGAIYYALSGGELVEKTVLAGGKVEANGWIVIPKDSISGNAHPISNGVATFEVEDGDEVFVSRISFYFNKEDLFDAIYNLSYTFFDEDGSVILSKNTVFGDRIEVPTGLTKAEDQAYTYEFAGWDLNGDGEVDELPNTLKDGIEAVAVYNADIKQYTVTFLSSDGNSVIEQRDLDYGSEIVAPKVDGLFGWDLDGDGAIESLPKTLTKNLTVNAVIAEKQYENATVIFDAGAVSDVTFNKITYTTPNTTSLHNTYSKTRENDLAPSGRVATYEYNYTNGTVTHSGSNLIKLATPYTGSTEGLTGFAIWVDVPQTTESYIGGLRLNNANSRIQPKTKGWTLIDKDGNVTTQDAKWKNESSFPEIGKGFTGWILVDLETFDYKTYDITPSAGGFIMFQIADNSDGKGRSTSYTMNIGQLLFYSDKDAIIEELVTPKERKLTYTFSDGKETVYKSGVVEKGESIIVPQDPVHENEDMFFGGWDINFDGVPDSLPTDGKITENLIANAIFYHKDAFETLYDGEGRSFKLSDGKYVNLTPVEYSSSPTGKAMKVSVNPDKRSITTAQHLTIDIPEARSPKGIAVWLDCTGQPELKLHLWINFLAKMVIADGGDYCYLVSEDGNTTLSNSWRTIVIPAGFKGWMIMPMTTFKINNFMPGDVLRMAVPYTGDGTYIPNDYSCEFYLGECVIFNCEVEYFMNQVSQRVYTFEDYDGRIISNGRLLNGEELPVPQNPEREDFAFLGWDINGDGKVDELPEDFGRNIVAKAVYKSEKYFTYKFVEEDGTVILERNALYGSLILPPYNYSKSEGIYVYIPSYGEYKEGMRLENDVEFTVTYTREVRKVTYTFLVDGKVVKTQTVDGGTVILAPENPTKPEEEHYVYEFSGWSGFTTGMTAMDDHTFEAQFERVAKQYTYTFMVDGVSYGSGKLAYGEVIVLPETPTKEGDEQYVYEFRGWIGYESGMTISGDVTFNAVFDKTVRVFTITFVDEDGVTVISQKKVPYGSRVNPPAAPYKSGYEFVEWENYYGMAEVTADATYRAIYQKIAGESSGTESKPTESAPTSESGKKKGCKSSASGEIGLLITFGLATVIIARKKRQN